MGLPIIPKKLFDVKSKFIPKGKITMSPFTTGIETVLLQVKDSTDEQEQVAALKQVIEACVHTKDVNVGTLPLFVIEELFIRLMQNSVSDIVDLAYTCTSKEKDDKQCNNRIELKVDLKKFNIKEDDGHTNKVVVADPIGIQFKYPNIDMADDATPEADETDTIIQCIDLIFDGDDVHSASDYTKEEVTEFWKQLTLLQKKEVYDKFFNTMPHMQYKTSLTCSKCGTVHPIEFNSVLDLFL